MINSKLAAAGFKGCFVVGVENGKLLILGDWLSFFTYGYFDGNDLSLIKWTEDEHS